MNPLKLYEPFDKGTIDNPFGNAGIAPSVLAYYRAALNLDGHPGADFNVPWGTKIPNCFPGAYVSALLSKDNPDLMAYRAVNTIIDLPGVSYELQYGHVSTILAEVGKTYQVGDTLALVGNTGDVFHCGPNGCPEVTTAQKASSDPVTAHLGAHLHFQLRVLAKVPEAVSLAKGNDVHRLNNGSGDLVVGGYVYEIPNFNNGYNGCIDPVIFLNGILASVQGQLNATHATLEAYQAAPTKEGLASLVTTLEAFLGFNQ